MTNSLAFHFTARNGTHLARGLARAFCAVALLVLVGCSSAPKVGGGSLGGGATSGHSESGMASYYGNEFQSRKTASGERFDQGKLTAAHRTLPFGTRLKVINTQNGRSVVVRVNDRGPFARGRIIDLSRSAFKSIASLNSGVVHVHIQVVD
jgi:rare lipoprotein A